MDVISIRGGRGKRTEDPAGLALPLPGGSLPGRSMRTRLAFTLVELALVVSIVGILAAVAAPRFFARTSFEEPFFVQELLSGLRYAQKLAVASGCDVEVSFPPGGSFVLRQRSACRTGPFALGVPHPGTGEAAYTSAAPPGVTLTSSVDPLIFDALGQARNGSLAVSDATITVGSASLRVVGDTGFSFDPAA